MRGLNQHIANVSSPLKASWVQIPLYLGYNKLMLDFTSKEIERFWSHVTKTDSCWLCDLYGSRGYSTFHLRRNSTNKFILAHRLSWMLHKGGIPDGLFVCHKCDIRKCVNPDHLFLGTNLDNINDMNAKGRGNFVANLKIARVRALTDTSRNKRLETFNKIGHQQGSKNSSFGTFWITNGFENKKWKNTIGELPEGYSKGRKIKV